MHKPTTPAHANLTNANPQGDETDEVQWPKELLPLRGRCFSSQEELDKALEELGCADVSGVFLNKDGLVEYEMPSRQHNNATDYIDHKFHDWAKGLTGRWGTPSSTVGLRIIDPGTNLERDRDPDVSFWGYPKCRWYKKKYVIKSFMDQNEKYNMDPHVVIQFSWKNFGYKEAALDDLMSRAGQGPGNEAPRVGYLIKVRFETRNGRQRAVGFDIYKVPQGSTVQNAVAGNAGKHWEYTHGQADVVITITPDDLGIPPATIGYIFPRRLYCGDFTLSMEDLWDVVVDA